MTDSLDDPKRSGRNLRTRRFTGDASSLDRAKSKANFDINDVLDSAKVKFELEQVNTAEFEKPPVSPSRHTKRKISSAPASPGKALSVSVGDEATSSKRFKTDTEGDSSSLLMTTADSRKPSSLLEDDKKAKSNKKKSAGVSMSEVIRLHQAS